MGIGLFLSSEAKTASQKWLNTRKNSDKIIFLKIVT
jgi:hypothetical protein